LFFNFIYYLFKTKKVNFLDNLELIKFFPVYNGYVCQNDSSMKRKFPQPDEPEWQRLLGLTKVGYHSDIQGL